MRKNILIVGAGISGITCARELAELGHKVKIVEKRDHIGGNCYDYINDVGVLVPKYGPHVFHTNSVRIWEYVQKFSKWDDYTHRVLSLVDGKYVPIPVNITTINMLFDAKLETSDDMIDWIQNRKSRIAIPENSEEMALSLVGRGLYEKMFKPYTIKQWGIEPKYLDASIMARIPIYYSHNDTYFTDAFQAMPSQGYTKMFENMLNHKNIKVLLDTNYKRLTTRKFDLLIYTGKIDDYFNNIKVKLANIKVKLPKLQYRSLKFVHLNKLNNSGFLPAATVNLPQDLVFTRVCEPKQFTRQKCHHTTLIYEFPTSIGEAYYPVINPKNLEIFKIYEGLNKNKNVYFVGRLAQFKYFNMDEAFKNALMFIDKLKEDKIV
jgi:UDP-galactopyranose mutase